MAKAKTSERFKLFGARLSFPNLWTPKQFSPSQGARFEASFLLDPSDPEHAKKLTELKAGIKKLALEAFDGKIPGDLKYCLTNNSNEDGSQKKEYDGYAGMYVLTTAKPADMEDIPAGQPGAGINNEPGPRQGKPLQRARKIILAGGIEAYGGQPNVVNRALAPVREGQPEAPYAGCIVDASIQFWAQDNKFGKRINANLVTVRFVKDAPAFGRGSSAAEDDFEPIEAPSGASEADSDGFDL